MARYIFLIGAAKCGTTALANLLSLHPQVCASVPKEPKYFTDERFSRGAQWYDGCFASEPDTPWRLDASVDYSVGWGGSSANIAQRIKLFSPDAKILFMYRDPVERTWSAYWHAVRGGYESRTFSEVIRDSGSAPILGSMYHQRMSEYLQEFPKEQMLILPQLDLLNDPQDTVNRIAGFVGLEPFLLDEASAGARVNTTYQLTKMGELVHKTWSRGRLVSISQWVRDTFPSWLVMRMKTLYSKPLPQMNDSDRHFLTELYQRDFEHFLREYGPVS